MLMKNFTAAWLLAAALLPGGCASAPESNPRRRDAGQ
jgi:hypothetical protein